MCPQSSKQPTRTLVSQLQDKLWFQKLSHATQQRNQLQKWLEQSLPEDLNGKYYALEVKDATLYLGTRNASWAARLRYTIPQMINQLQKNHKALSRVQEIKCLIMPPIQETTASWTATALPEGAAQSMIAIAHSVTDPDLKAALLKLAKNKET